MEPSNTQVVLNHKTTRHLLRESRKSIHTTSTSCRIYRPFECKHRQLLCGNTCKTFDPIKATKRNLHTEGGAKQTTNELSKTNRFFSWSNVLGTAGKYIRASKSSSITSRRVSSDGTVKHSNLACHSPPWERHASFEWSPFAFRFRRMTHSAPTNPKAIEPFLRRFLQRCLQFPLRAVRLLAPSSRRVSAIMSPCAPGLSRRVPTSSDFT